MRIQYLSLLSVWILLAACTIQPVLAQTTTILLEAERTNILNLEAALERADPEMCPDCDSVHVALLRETVNVLRQADSLAKANADTLARANLFASVEKLLTAQQTKVQADVQHIYLYAALERKLQALQKKAQDPAFQARLEGRV